MIQVGGVQPNSAVHSRNNLKLKAMFPQSFQHRTSRFKQPVTHMAIPDITVCVCACVCVCVVAHFLQRPRLQVSMKALGESLRGPSPLPRPPLSTHWSSGSTSALASLTQEYTRSPTWGQGSHDSHMMASLGFRYYSMPPTPLYTCVWCGVHCYTCRLGLFLLVAPSKESSGREAGEWAPMSTRYCLAPPCTMTPTTRSPFAGTYCSSGGTVRYHCRQSDR